MPYVSLEDSSLGKYLAALQIALINILQEAKAGYPESTKEYLYSLKQLETIASALPIIQDFLGLFSNGSKPGVFGLFKRYMSGDIKKISSDLPKQFINPRPLFFKKLLENLEPLSSAINESNQLLIKEELKAQLARKAPTVIREEQYHPEFNLNQCLSVLNEFINDYDLLKHSTDMSSGSASNLAKALSEGFANERLAGYSTYQYLVCHPISFDFTLQMLELSSLLPERLDDLLGFLDPDVLKSSFFSTVLPKLLSFVKRFSDLVYPEDNSTFKFSLEKEEIDLGHYYRAFRQGFIHYLGALLQNYIDSYSQSEHIKLFIERMTLVNHYIFKQQQEKLSYLERLNAISNREDELLDSFDDRIRECNVVLAYAEHLEKRKSEYYTKSFIELISDYPELCDFFWSWHRGQNQSISADFKLPHYIFWSGYFEETNLVAVLDQLTLHDRQIIQRVEHLKQVKNRMIDAWSQHVMRSYEKNKSYQMNFLEILAQKLEQLSDSELLKKNSIHANHLDNNYKALSIISQKLDELRDELEAIELEVNNASILPAHLKLENQSIEEWVIDSSAPILNLIKKCYKKQRSISSFIEARERIYNTASERLSCASPGHFKADVRDSLNDQQQKLVSELLQKNAALDAKVRYRDALLVKRLDYQRRIPVLSENILASWRDLTEEQQTILNHIITRLRRFSCRSFFSPTSSSSHKANESITIQSLEELNNLSKTILKQIEGYEQRIQQLRLTSGGSKEIERRLYFLDAAKICFLSSPDKLPFNELDTAYYTMWIPGLAWWNKGRGIQWLLTCLNANAIYSSPTDRDRDAIESILDEAIASNRQLKAEFEGLSFTEQQLTLLTGIELFIENTMMPPVRHLDKLKLKLAEVNKSLIQCVEEIEHLAESIGDIEYEISMLEFMEMEIPSHEELLAETNLLGPL